MTRQETLIPQKKKRGPKPTGQGKQINVRLHPPEMRALDDWIDRQDDSPTRPEAVRRILGKALSASGSE